LKLQAFLDGELPEGEAREVLAWTRRDAAAAALLAELRNTGQALAKSGPCLSVPESREFYWSKIEREIRSLEQRKISLASRFFRRFLLPAAGLAALALVAVLAARHFTTAGASHLGPGCEVEVAMIGSDPFTYHDYSKGTTLVWLSYPAENESSDSGSDDTLD